jgi:hypothetical protein
MYPHRIRLRGPWTLKTGTGQILSVNIGETSTAELDPTTGAVQLYRRFSWLQPLQPHERLWFVLERSAVTGATLNDRTLELAAVAEGHQECEITLLVKRSNQLSLDVAAGQRRLPFPQVALEVRCRTFLRQPAWHIDATNCRLAIAGQLVGANETPLELYVRVGEVNVLYTLVHAHESCSPFRYESEIPAAVMDRKMPIQIDLVKGGVIWHRAIGRLGDEPESR